jgi:hypothetical protein
MKLGKTWWVAAVLLVISIAVVASLVMRISPRVQERLLEALNERFNSQVEVTSLRVAVFPRPAVTGEGLSLRHRNRTDVPPLIKIRRFSAAAGLLGLLGAPIRLRHIELDGLEIHVPAGGLDGEDDPPSPAEQAERQARAQRPGAIPATAGPSPPSGDTPLLIDRITTRDARLEIASRTPGKPPRTFEIGMLDMRDFGFDRAATFEAAVLNPVPRGAIDVKGRFGPWNRDEPRLTAVSADYVFSNADLNTIDGLAGILASAGQLSGPLERIAVRGRTETPNFSVDVAGQPVDLRTSFEAVVDGTSGDTWLQPVEARFGQSTVTARGGVVRGAERGREISLDVEAPDARMEDVLKFAIPNAKPPITGKVTFAAKLEIPARQASVIDKLRLDGRFKVAEALFTSLDVQKQINLLSARGRGELGDDGPTAVSNFNGRFRLASGTLSLSDLEFSVPGAVVQLTGTYGLKSEALDFRGYLLLDARLSETTTGFKSLLATLAQPLFRREGGGSKLPIRIEGTRRAPRFTLDLRRALRRGD